MNLKRFGFAGLGSEGCGAAQVKICSSKKVKVVIRDEVYSLLDV